MWHVILDLEDEAMHPEHNRGQRKQAGLKGESRKVPEMLGLMLTVSPNQIERYI
jgi:hypothetical protein